MGLWLLEGVQEYSDLLRFALSKETWRTSMVVIALDYSRPWTLESSALKWLRVLQQAWEALPLSAGERDEAQEEGTYRSCRGAAHASACGHLCLTLTRVRDCACH